jgi:hypothetical protein
MIKVERVTRDENRDVVDRKRIGKFSHVVDEENEVQEWIETNMIDYEELHIDKGRGFVQVVYRMGGKDTGGKFVPDPRWPVASSTLYKDQQPEEWEKMVTTRRVWNIDAMLKWLHEQRAFTAAGREVWKIPNIESEHVPEAP